MIEMKFSTEDKALLVYKITRYFNDELGQNIGNFDAEFLIGFFVEQIGPAIYNKGLNDAHNILLERVEEFGYLLQEQEKPTDYGHSS